MTYGIIFYWFSWIMWVFITFLMNKNSLRTFCAVWLMSFIFLSNINVSVGNVTINVSYLVLLLSALTLITQIKKPYYNLFVSFTMMIGYAGVLFWRDLTPLWLFFPEIMIVPLICSLLMVISTKNLSQRLITGVLGMAAGELLYHLILASYNIYLPIGSMAFFDSLYLAAFLVALITVILKGHQQLYALLNVFQQRNIKANIPVQVPRDDLTDETG